MTKYLSILLLLVMMYSLSACSIGIPWAPGEGGIEDGEYYYNLYDNKNEFILNIDGDKITLFICEKDNYYGRAEEIKISAIEGSYLLDDDQNIVITATEGYVQKKYVGTEEGIRYYKGKECANLKRLYESGDYTKEEYEGQLALTNGEKQKREQLGNVKATVRIDKSNGTLYVLKIEGFGNDQATQVFNYRQDGSLKDIQIYQGGIIKSKQLFDDHNNYIEEGVIREYHANGKVKKEFYPAKTYLENQDCTLEYDLSGKLIKQIVVGSFTEETEYVYNEFGELEREITIFKNLSGSEQKTESYIYYKDDIMHYIKWSLYEDNDGESQGTIEKIRRPENDDDLYSLQIYGVQKIEVIDENTLRIDSVNYYGNQLYHLYKFRDDKVITYNKDGNIIEEQQYVLKQTESEDYDGEIYEDHKYGYLHVTYTDDRFDRCESEYDINGKWLWTKGYKENKVVYEYRIEEDGTLVEKFYDNNGNVVSVCYEYMQGKGENGDIFGIEISYNNGEKVKESICKKNSDGSYTDYIYDAEGKLLAKYFSDENKNTTGFE